MSCNGVNSGNVQQEDSSRVITGTKADTDSLSAKHKVQEQAPDVKTKILGTWALAGMENASFVIEKDSISYPETFTSYKYSIFNDSIKIAYDDYVGSFSIEMKGLDTLIMKGDEQQIYSNGIITSLAVLSSRSRETDNSASIFFFSLSLKRSSLILFFSI
jgi:hypothetical protein